MGASLFSPSWYRVAALKPRLRSHVEIHRHNYRGEPWYILQDHATGRFQRFTPAAYLLIGLMDGERTVQEIWEEARSRLGDEAPTQDEMIRLLSRIHAADVLQCDVPPDSAEVLKRFEQRRSSKWKQNVRSPLFMRISIWDPERLLSRLLPFARPLFSRAGGLLWLAMVVVGLFVAGVHWAELTGSITDRILAPQNILLLWLTFPFLKVLHEFGHAFAIKALGGEVHEIGIVMLVFTPIPYVDASSASAFRSKWERIVVSAAGMAVELVIAVLALLLWIYIEPGGIRAVLYNVIFIAGVSSLFFNGNPLLRYDAYYMLSDLLEIPNLGSRGMQYVTYLAQRYCFGVSDAEPPLSTGGERIWFVIYTVAAFFYRIFIYLSIILFLGGQFFFLGIVFAIWAAVTMIVLPIVKAIKFLFSSPTLGKKRNRAILVSGLALAVALGFISLVPVPLSTLAEGVIWLPENVFVRAATEGFVNRLMVSEGAVVKRGDPLVQCFDPLLPARISGLESRLRELKARYDAEVLTKRVQSEITKEEMAHVKAELQRSRERDAELLIHSSADGVFHSPMAQDLPGRFVKRGEMLGYVLDRSTLTVRAVVSQSDVDFVRQRSVGVKIRLPERLSETLRAVVKRELPAATEDLPSRTLGQQGGGQVPVAPQDQMGIKAFQKLFLFDLEVPDESCFYNVGGRAYVRFDHGWEPLMWRWYRSIRELFMRRFNV